MGKRKKTLESGKRPRTRHPRARPVLMATSATPAQFPEAAGERSAQPETSPRLTGGDVDADWRSASSVGEEAVGGSVATPDQDIVDALGEALGVAQEPDAPVQTSSEILAERDAHRWRIEREIAREQEDPR